MPQADAESSVIEDLAESASPPVPDSTRVHRRGWARLWYASGFGLLTGLVLLGLVECALHQDRVMQRYRAVFGVGRAIDKVLHVEAHSPRLLLLGNSRMDNGFDPKVIAPMLGMDDPYDVFNLGIPGANLNILYGVMDRLDGRRLLGPPAIEKVVIELDETEFQDDDSLNLGVFLSDRGTLLGQRDYSTWCKTWLRLWGYAPNLKGLREPGSLERFAYASVGEVEAWGGAAKDNLGYRPGVRDRFQTLEQLQRQDAYTRRPPSETQTRLLWQLLDLLEARGVESAILYPPLLNRKVAMLPGEAGEENPYREIARALRRRGVPQLTAGAHGPGDVADFANAGHLNDRGGRRYSRALGEELRGLWGTEQAGVLSR